MNNMGGGGGGMAAESLFCRLTLFRTTGRGRGGF